MKAKYLLITFLNLVKSSEVYNPDQHPIIDYLKKPEFKLQHLTVTYTYHSWSTPAIIANEENTVAQIALRIEDLRNYKELVKLVAVIAKLANIKKIELF